MRIESLRSPSITRHDLQVSFHKGRAKEMADESLNCEISKRDKNTSNNLSMESHSNCARAIEMSTHGPHSNYKIGAKLKTSGRARERV